VGAPQVFLNKVHWQKVVLHAQYERRITFVDDVCEIASHVWPAANHATKNGTEVSLSALDVQDLN